MRAPAVAAALAALVGASSPAMAGDHLPWYRGFYTRVGWRDSFGASTPFGAFAALSFGLGYRHELGRWGVDGSVLDMQWDPNEGLHEAARALLYVELPRALRVDAWLAAGLAYGWVHGNVERPLPFRNGRGFHADVLLGVELPRSIGARLFVQCAFTAPLYNTYDQLESTDSRVYVYALEGALGVRF